MMAPASNEFLGDFESEAQERLERLEELLLRLESTDPADPGVARALVGELGRELHTLKGNAGMMGFSGLQAEAHAMEDLAAALDPRRPAVELLLAGVDRCRGLLRAAGEVDTAGQWATLRAGTSASARIPLATLDSLVDLMAEVVIARNRSGEALARTRPLRALGGDAKGGDAKGRWSEVDEAREHLDAALDRLQEGVLRLRMVPLRPLFRQLERIVHDTGAQEGKLVRLAAEGGDTPLDKALLELASEALGHLVRNAVIHGLEPPAQRRRAGKDEYGLLRLTARATSREVSIDVADDGRGIQLAALRAAAARRAGADQGAVRRRGAAPRAEAARRAAGGPAPGLPPDPGLVELLFLPGVSTRPHADLDAGRGMGLAAVREAVQRRGGRIEVASEEGKGSLFRLRLPLSASIARALLLRCDGEDYSLPLPAVLDTLRLRAGDLHEVNGAGALRWRRRVIAALDLGCGLGTAARRRREGYAVVIAEGGRARALLVDELLGLRDVVVKSLDRLVAAVPGFAGSTVLGDGRAVLILDSFSLLGMSPIVETAG
jgi:two-component system chemotaxis sensor kinase CheA